MSRVVASVVSAPTPINGQDHNSSPNFQFVDLPSGGDLSITIGDTSSANSITFTLWHEKNNWPDSEVATDLGNGSTIGVDKVEEDANYYIGDPAGATENFTVTFYAS